MQIAVLTPTYNRKELLARLFDSLMHQDDTNFVWIIIDDGSNDGTEEFIMNKLKGNYGFSIRYLKQKNGGKARALNKGFQFFEDIDLFAVVDSDDTLLSNAISHIKLKAEQYMNNDRVGGIFFRYQDEAGNILHSKGKMLKKELVTDRMEHDSKYSKDDGCMSYYKRAVSKYNYPEYENENYVGPIVLQMIMANEYKIAFTNIVIGIAEYQINGLTHMGKRLRIKNPLGMICYCQLMQVDQFRLLTRIKYAIMSNAYAYIGNISEKYIEKYCIKKGTLTFWTKFPGVILGFYWKVKYD